MGKGLDRFRANNPNYRAGDDFYPDRLVRDERAAVRQFWDSPHQDPEFMEYIESFPSGKEGNWKREQEKDAWIKTLRDVDLRNRGTEGRYHPGPVTIADERFGVDYRRPGESWGLVGLLKDTRAEQMKKYHPYYGMTEKHFKEMQPPTNIYHRPFGDEKGVGFFEDPKRYLLDQAKEASRIVTDNFGYPIGYGANVLGQALWPKDYEDPSTSLMYPRGFWDLYQQSINMGEFEDAGYGMSPEKWEKLGYSEKMDIQKQFEELTGSEFAYDPTYKPVTGKNNLIELMDYLAEGPLMPSSSYRDMGTEVPDYWFGGDELYTHGPMTNAMISGQLASILGSRGAAPVARKAVPNFLKGIAQYMPEIARKHPIIASLFGLTVPSIAEPWIE